MVIPFPSIVRAAVLLIRLPFETCFIIPLLTNTSTFSSILALTASNRETFLISTEPGFNYQLRASVPKKCSFNLFLDC
jgi:hypothetical protein